MNNFNLISCPFCKGTDFDLYGLKYHLTSGWCDEYNSTQQHFCACGQEVEKEGARCPKCYDEKEMIPDMFPGMEELLNNLTIIKKE